MVLASNTLKVVSFNVNGILNPIKRGKILSKLRREGAQVAFLQETHLSEIEHAKLRRWGFKHVFHWYINRDMEEGLPSLSQVKSNMNIFQRLKIKKANM